MNIDYKKTLKGLNLLISSYFILPLTGIALSVCEMKLVNAEKELVKVSATVTGDALSGSTLTVVMIAFFSYLLLIAGSIIQLAGVSKVRKTDKTFTPALIPAILIFLAILVIFYLEAAGVSSVNPMISGIARVVSNISYIVISIIIFRGCESLNRTVGDEKTADYCRKTLLQAILLFSINFICATMISFLGTEMLQTVGVIILIYIRATVFLFGAIRLCIILFPTVWAVKKHRENNENH